MSGPWHRAIAFALVGEEFDLGVQSAPDLGAVVGDLDRRGWGPDRVVAHARQVGASGAWPHLVPDALRVGLGAAQLAAAITGARARYGLEVLTVLPPSRRRTLDADERRLLADKPPHFGT